MAFGKIFPCNSTIILSDKDIKVADKERNKLDRHSVYIAPAISRS